MQIIAKLEVTTFGTLNTTNSEFGDVTGQFSQCCVLKGANSDITT